MKITVSQLRRIIKEEIESTTVDTEFWIEKLQGLWADIAYDVDPDEEMDNDEIIDVVADQSYNRREFREFNKLPRNVRDGILNKIRF